MISPGAALLARSSQGFLPVCEEFCCGVYHELLLLLRHLRKKGKRKDVLTGFLRLRKGALDIAQIGKRRLEMKRMGIINLSWNPATA